VKTVLEKFEEKDAETSFLFVDAIEKLDKIDVQAKDSKKQIDVQANESKKQIVRELAKSLEGKIPTDTICIEITNRLRGRVSDRFIRQCLDEKYKQEGPVNNAKKQKNPEQKDKAIDKLAVVTPLGQVIEEREEEKEDIMMDTDGRISIEEKDKPPTTIDFSVITNKTIVPVSYPQEHQLKEKTNPGLEECSSCNDLRDENRELKEALEKSSQFATADKILPVSATATYDIDKGNDILPFEFSTQYKELQNHMVLQFQNSGNRGKVWFNGKINIKTREVISTNIGRIEEQVQDESSP
jgi:hypothetical protein